MVAMRVWTRCIKSKVNSAVPHRATGVLPNRFFRKRYSTGTISTPNRVPINRQPKGTMPKIMMPTDKISLPRGGWDTS